MAQRLNLLRATDNDDLGLPAQTAASDDERGFIDDITTDGGPDLHIKKTGANEFVATVDFDDVEEDPSFQKMIEEVSARLGPDKITPSAREAMKRDFARTRGGTLNSAQPRILTPEEQVEIKGEQSNRTPQTGSETREAASAPEPTNGPTETLDSEDAADDTLKTPAMLDDTGKAEAAADLNKGQRSLPGGGRTLVDSDLDGDLLNASEPTTAPTRMAAPPTAAPNQTGDVATELAQQRTKDAKARAAQFREVSSEIDDTVKNLTGNLFGRGVSQWVQRVPGARSLVRQIQTLANKRVDTALMLLKRLQLAVDIAERSIGFVDGLKNIVGFGVVLSETIIVPIVLIVLAPVELLFLVVFPTWFSKISRVLDRTVKRKLYEAIKKLQEVKKVQGQKQSLSQAERTNNLNVAARDTGHR